MLKPVTPKNICDHIAAANLFEKEHTSEEIFNYFTSSENLYKLSPLYSTAVIILNRTYNNESAIEYFEEIRDNAVFDAIKNVYDKIITDLKHE